MIADEMLKALSSVTLGLDAALTKASMSYDKKKSYPPYNIFKIGDNKYVIEIAVAGFKKDEIEVEVRKDSLYVSGKSDRNSRKDIEYIYRGISFRDFRLSWAISNDIVVDDAVLEDGLLTITLSKIVPEEELPKKIEIK